jgi:solute carrier family 10 (sodium/bile acid cotransporter), member 7
MPDDDQRDSEKTPAPPRSGIRRALDFAWFLLKDQWFLVGIGVVTLIASQVQVPLAQQNVKQLVVSYLSGMLTCLI